MADINSLEGLRGRVNKLQEAKMNAEKVVMQHQAAFDAALANLKEMFDVDSLEEGEEQLKLLKAKVAELGAKVEALVDSAEKAMAAD